MHKDVTLTGRQQKVNERSDAKRPMTQVDFDPRLAKLTSFLFYFICLSLVKSSGRGCGGSMCVVNENRTTRKKGGGGALSFRSWDELNLGDKKEE